MAVLLFPVEVFLSQYSACFIRGCRLELTGLAFSHHKSEGHFGHIHQYPKNFSFIKKNLGEGEGWDLLSDQ